MPLRSIPSVVARNTDGRHYVAAQMKASRRISVAVGVAGTGVAFAACAHVLGRHPIGNSSVPQPAKSVDLEKYLGRWFEIARYEQRFQKGCTGVTADYSLRQDGSINVVNRCRKRGGHVDEARGRAKVVDRATNAKLKVSFFGPFYGHYWVLDHADDYSWSIVGEPSGRYLWILARSPRLPENEVSQLFARAQALGYNTTMLLRTIQP
jgi:apolipoprotein D and lipocalin family protein